MAARFLRGGLKQVMRPSHLKVSLAALSTSPPPSAPRVLITGGLGQLGQGVAKSMREDYGKNNVILSDIVKPTEEILSQGPYVHADVCDLNQLRALVVNHRIDWLVHFAALLSAIGEQHVERAMEVNIVGVLNVLKVSREHKLRIFIPSTIGAFGESSPREPTPDLTIQRPRTIYGVAKVYAELLGEYYFKKFGVDFRSLRFPGVISVDTPPGGGTTDYAIHMVKDAVEKGRYDDCFLTEDTRLPMIYYPDLIKATRLCLDAPEGSFSRHDKFMRTYNIQGVSFTPAEWAAEIQKHIPGFQLAYKVDKGRQEIADSWPRVLDDTWAREDLGWKPDYDDLEKMIEDIIKSMKTK